jgi:hypothetical protein
MSGITQASCSVNTKYIYGITVAKKSEYDEKHGRAIASPPPPTHTHTHTHVYIMLHEILIPF